MRFAFYLLFFLSLTLIKCNSHHNKSSVGDTKSLQYVFIKGIVQTSDSIFLDADYIQYLTGETAIEAAKEAGAADTTKTEGGQIQIGVPNDYFILNENAKSRRLPISEDCKYDFLISLDRPNRINDNSPESLRKIYEDGPFLLAISNGIIFEITEVFTP